MRSSSPALRVVYVHDAISDNGAVRTTLDVVERLVRRGMEASVFALFSIPPALVPAFGEHVPIRRGLSGRRRGRWELPALFARLLKECRSADVIVCGSELGPGLVAGGFVARLAGTPYVTVVQADLELGNKQWMSPWMRPLVLRAHRRADAVICVSREIAARVVNAGVTADRIHVVSNGVDVERLRRVQAQASNGNSAPPRLVGLGRLSPEKGFDLLIRAHAAVRADIYHELLLIGSGPELDRLRALAAELGVEDSVRFSGFQADPFPLVAGGSAFVLSSRREGLPLALLEAMALGVPVIATRCTTAIDDILAHGAFGDVVAMESVGGLAEAIRRHLRAPVVLQQRVQAAAAHVERYSIDETTAGQLRVLHLVHERATPRLRRFPFSHKV